MAYCTFLYWTELYVQKLSFISQLWMISTVFLCRSNPNLSEFEDFVSLKISKHLVFDRISGVDHITRTKFLKNK